jgi:hypothetical protein
VVNHHSGLARGDKNRMKKTSVFLSKHHPSKVSLPYNPLKKSQMNIALTTLKELMDLLKKTK